MRSAPRCHASAATAPTLTLKLATGAEIVAVCAYEANALKEITLYPIDMGFGRPIPQRGRPLLAQGQVARDTLRWLQQVSKPFGTEIAIEDDVGIIRL